MVINRGAFLAGDLALVQDEIAAVVAACRPAALKVIFETSELETYDNIRAASFLAMRVLRPGDFIKTSTGKTSANATLGNNQVMLEAIRDYYLDTGVAIGMKPAGGIKSAKQALTFLVAIKETIGDAWLTNPATVSAPPPSSTTSSANSSKKRPAPTSPPIPSAKPAGHTNIHSLPVGFPYPICFKPTPRPFAAEHP